MPRPRSAEVRRTLTARGTVFSLRFSYRGQRHTVRLGGDWEGWDEARVERERGFLMQKVERGEWMPPAVDPGHVSATVPSFQLVASEWLHLQAVKAGDPEHRSKTIRDLEWRLSVLMDVFGDVPIDRVGYRHAEDLAAALVAERLEIERARELGRRLAVAYTDPRTGRRHERRRRGVANSSIRRCLAVAERVLRDARRRGLLSGELPELTAAAPRAERPRRSYLEPEQIAAVLRAAGALESERRGLDWGAVERIRASEASARALARELGVSDTLIGKVRRGELWVHEPAPRNRNDVPRLVVVQTLLLAGPRISELCGLDAHHLDLAGGRLQVPLEVTKTEAGDRVVPLLPALLDALRAYRLARPAGPSAPAFTTRTGTRQRPDNIRARIIGPVLVRANALLAAEGRVPIAHLTPHTLRRTFASLLAVCDVPPRRAMYLMGHTDATFTMSVYQQVLDAGPGALEVLEAVLGTSLADAREVFTGTGPGVFPRNSPVERKRPASRARDGDRRPSEMAR